MDILLISDQPLTVLALRAVLQRDDRAANVVDAAYMAEAMSMLSGPHAFGMIVLDLDTHGVRAVSTTALLRELWPQVPLVVLASSDADAAILRSVELGVAGYLLKTADTDSLRDAFRRIREGQVVVPPIGLEA